MTQIIRRRVNHEDKSFTRPLTKEVIKPLKKLDRLVQKKQELKKQQRIEIAERKRNSIFEKRLEEMALNFGFTNYGIYDLYRAEMRSAHDIYRKPQMSIVWLHNSLWEADQDTIQGEEIPTQRQQFVGNSWLKKIGFMELRELQRSCDYINSSEWYDSEIFLPDLFVIKQAPAMTQCKKLELSFSLFSQISTRKVYELRVSLVSIVGQYYMTHEIKPCEAEILKERKLRSAPKMAENKETFFDKCHVDKRNGIERNIISQYDHDNFKSALVSHLRSAELKEISFDFSAHLIAQTKLQQRAPKKIGVKKTRPFIPTILPKSDTLFLENFRAYTD